MTRGENGGSGISGRIPRTRKTPEPGSWSGIRLRHRHRHRSERHTMNRFTTVAGTALLMLAGTVAVRTSQTPQAPPAGSPAPQTTAPQAPGTAAPQGRGGRGQSMSEPDFSAKPPV